jgi:AcrR family transcriptional regulator
MTTLRQPKPKTSHVSAAVTAAAGTGDRRVLRTREALRVALMELMVEVGWDGMEVQTLCARANVGRSTFYQHFLNKEELLVSSLGDLQSMLEQQAQTAPAGQAGLRFVPGLFDHAFEAQELFRAVIGRRSAQYVQDRFRDMVVELVMKERLPAGAQPWHAKAQAHCLGGALMELMVWWLSVKRVHKPSDMVALFAQWSAPMLTPPT